MEVARARGQREVQLSAQTHAVPFYERHGYVVCGAEYLDAGIAHVDMRRDL
jgi:predicted GNAT family N-acyltransferase